MPTLSAPGVMDVGHAKGAALADRPWHRIDRVA